MKKVMDIQVYETDDYDSFKRLKGNRDVKNAKKIIRSIKENGWIFNPIKVNEKMEVIDGQNRLMALQELGMPVQYYIDEGATIETARALNLGMTNWKPLDYVQSYAEDGVESYQLLLKLLKENSWVSLQEAGGIINRTIITHGYSFNHEDLKRGEFTMTLDDYKRAQAILNDLKEIRNQTKDIPGSRRTITTAMSWCMQVPGCDVKRLIRVFKKKYPLIRPVVSPELFLYDITKIYNSGLQHGKINFDVLYRDR